MCSPESVHPTNIMLRMSSSRPLCQAEWCTKLRTEGVKKLFLVLPARQLRILDKAPHPSTSTYPLSALGCFDCQRTVPQAHLSKTYRNTTSLEGNAARHHVS